MDTAALERFDKLRDEAIQHTVDACARELPALWRRFGERATEFCTEDTRFHLEFLRPTLETGDSASFHEYLGWLVEVLASRQVPTDSLAYSLRALARFFQERMPDDGGAIIARTLEDAALALADGIPAPDYTSQVAEPLPEHDEFRDAALAGDRRRIGALFQQALQREASLTEVSVKLVQPVLYEVGNLWQQNKVSVAQEHLISALMQAVLSQGYALVAPIPDKGRRALFACVEGNHHTLGLQIVADAFEVAGWDVHFLGADTPSWELVRYAQFVKPELIGLTVALPSQLKHLRTTVTALRAAFTADVPRIAVGGLVINRFPALAARVDAEVLGADALSAVRAFS